MSNRLGPPDYSPNGLEWMPDWSGKTVVIVASGPSAKTVDLVQGAGLAQFIVINNSWKLAPWADVLYACDHQWWLKARGKEDWPGLRVSQDRITIDLFPKIKRVYTMKGVETPLIFDKPGLVSWAGNSGTQALNLAAIWGAKKIILVGFDMTIDHGVHWHVKHAPGLSNPRPMTIERWRVRTDAAYEQLTARGIQVINCSKISALKNYLKMTYEEALAA